MFPRSNALAVAGLSMALLFGCSPKNNPMQASDPAPNGYGTAMFKLAAAANSPFARIAKTVTLTISAPDMNTQTKALTKNDTTVTGTVVGIPAGKSRTFKVDVFDSVNVKQYTGSAVADVVAEDTVIVNISVVRMSGGAVVNGTVNEGAQDFTILCITSDLVSGRGKILAVDENTAAEMFLTTEDSSCNEAQWSPNGDLISYTRQNSNNYSDIWVMNADGSNKYRVTPIANQEVGSPSNPAWHNNGSEIMYQRFSSVIERMVYIINKNGTNNRVFFNNVNVMDCMPNMNPADSNKVAYYYDPGNWAPNAEIHIRTISTGADTVLKGNRGKGFNGGSMEYSPDGRYFIFSEYSETSPGYTSLMRITVADKSIVTLYTATSNEHAYGAFSRINGNVYFSVMNGSTNISKIYRCSVDGSNRTELVSKSNCRLTLTSVK